MTRVVFMGSPEFAVPSLRALVRDYTIVGVVTQPDRPAGRGRGLRQPAIKEEAVRLGLPVIQPARLAKPEALLQLRNWMPDLIVVAAFGQLLRREVLDLPKHGCVNVHASLLPRWRGAAPIQAAIAEGDADTGVTIMQMDAGMDTGAILLQRSLAIAEDDTADSLSEKLSRLGAQVLAETIPSYLSGGIHPTPQDGSLVTKAPLLKKGDGLLDAAFSAAALQRRVRAFNPWPGAFVVFGNTSLKVHRAHAAPGGTKRGDRLVVEGKPALATSDGILILDEVQLPGKRTMDGRDFLRGIKDWIT